MKKVISLFSIALFLGCSDMSVSDEAAIKDKLPADFKRSEYAEINLDVPKSQIAFKVNDKVKENFTGVSDPARVNECKDLLNPNGEISSLAIDIYSDYLDCPKDGWDENAKCPGVYSQVPSYNKFNIDSTTNPSVKDTLWKCCIGGDWKRTIKGKDTTWTGCTSITGGCWRGGKNDLITMDCKDIETQIVSTLCDEENLVLPTTLLSTMCRFVLPKAENMQNAEDYLKNFSYDSTLIEQHYILVGRNEGRPYKYCNGNSTGTLRSPDLALKVGSPVFYDYGAHLFCLNETDGLIYLLK